MVIKRERVKPCDRCRQPHRVLYRVRIDAAQNWIFVCPQCWQQVSPGNPFYQYGGTWKSRKRH
jgi:hypothetical protein